MKLNNHTLVGRLITITDIDHPASTGPHFSAGTYCAPSTTFWCTDEDMDDPNAPLILCRLTKIFSGSGGKYWHFTYDGGVYLGCLHMPAFRKGSPLELICGFPIVFKLQDISVVDFAGHECDFEGDRLLVGRS